ncbi:tonsoku-like protein [Brienomyrus brachyistius]|uniref:tonsoku-like protein n=1 Tax=Brienomyrus brachyistius TaxID=42636 RepID=UPI0020B28A5D|nr:tonsoku-like protein [Brienomyrus brachyistius]
MSPTREIKQLQKAKIKAQSTSNLKEEASLCNQLGEALARIGEFEAAIEEHRQELALSEVLQDVIGSAVANRKIGECFAELGNIETALKHQRRHLELARSVRDAAEEQRALATIGRTFLFRFESDQSRESLQHAEDAFRKSLSIVDERLGGAVPARELSEMRARLFLNLGFVYDGLKEPERCSDFIRRSIFIAEKNQLLEDLYRANFNLGSIHFRRERPSQAVRCLEQARDCARRMKDRLGESECCSSIGKVLLSLGDFTAARRSLKKAFTLGSQQPADRQAVRRMLKQAIRGCQLEEALSELGAGPSQEALGLWEQLGDLLSKVCCYSKALESYQSQLSSAVALGKPARELAVIHVSLAATYTDLRKPQEALGHYKQELELRPGAPKEECESWLNMAMCVEDSRAPPEEVERCYRSALRCVEGAGLHSMQRRVLKAWLAAQRRSGSAQCADTEARLLQLGDVDESEGEENEEEEEGSSEPQEDSDIQLSDSDDDLEEYDKLLPGRRRAARWNKRNEKGETCLHRACIDGNLKQVHFLVEQGHPINPRDYCGWTPLHEACNHGHLEVVAVLLDRGANVNDSGGPLCEGVTPLHDALGCGHFPVARLLLERGASAVLRDAKGLTPLDCLRKWWRTYSRELDQETRDECAVMERRLKAAMATACTAPVAPKPTGVLQDSQLFDAENSEPLLPSEGPCSSPEDQRSESDAVPSCLDRGRRQRGAEDAVLYGRDSPSDHSDSDGSISPLRPVRPRQRFPEPPPPARAPSQDCRLAAPPPPDCGPEDYQRTIRNLGSAQTRLLSQNLSEPCFSSTPAAPANCRPALVPEEDYLEDDWLEDDLGDAQPKKRRRVWAEQPERRREASDQRHGNSLDPSGDVTPSPRGGRSLHRMGQRSRQVKMTQLPGLVQLGRKEVSRPQSPSMEGQSGNTAPAGHGTQPHAVPQSMPASMPAPIRMRVKVQDNVFLIPVPHSEADSCTVSWLCAQAAQRYYQACGLLPQLSLQKEGALLCPSDPLLAVLQTNEEVLAEVCSWDLPPLPERYRKACDSLSVAENRLVSRLCEAQDGGPSVTFCGLSLPPAGLAPLLRALKLQASLTELRLSGNRLHDDVMPELVSALITMPKLRLLDISANCITGEGLKKASAVLDIQNAAAFPCLEELNLSANPLGDWVSQPLSSVLSACPLLATLSLQACGLTARFLQQHRLLLASTLAGTGHLRSVCLSHNALGSTGLELVLKSLPLHCLTHIHLSAVRTGPADLPGVEHLAKHLSQGDCTVQHLSLSANGLSDADVLCLARCLPLCPSLESLDLSGNPGVTETGLGALLAALRDTGRMLAFLDLQGCSVWRPCDTGTEDGLSSCVGELRLCSRRLEKLDRQALLHSLGVPEEAVLSRNSLCLIRTSPAP